MSSYDMWEGSSQASGDVPRRRYLSLLTGAAVTASGGMIGATGARSNQKQSRDRTDPGSVPAQATIVGDWIDRYRRLPDDDEVTVIDRREEWDDSTGPFCRTAMAKVLELASDTAVAVSLPEIVKAPGDPYPDLALENSAYGEILDRNAYTNLFERLLTEDFDVFPRLITIPGGDIRYVDLVHLATSILRFYDLHGYLPRMVETKIASTIGLLPWETPKKHSQFTNALDSDYTHENNKSVNDRNRVRYYGHRSMRREMLEKALEIIGDTTKPDLAANKINAWAIKSYKSANNIETMGNYLSGLEYASYRLHSSAPPSFKMNSLYRAAGFPAKTFADGAKVYLPSQGWKKYRIHFRDGYWNEELGHQTGLPLPKADDNLQGNATMISQAGRREGTPGTRTVWVNPADVLERDTAQFVDGLRSNGIDRLIFTVKPSSGDLFYDSTAYPERVVEDALGQLVAAAAGRDIEVAVAVTLLVDQVSAEANEGWRSVNKQGRRAPVSINLTSSDYESYITDVLTEITTNYDIDGVVLTHLYDGTLSSLNEETAEKFRKDTGEALSDHVSTEDRLITKELLEWKMNYTRAYAGRLAETVKSNRDIPVSYASYPLPGGYYRLDMGGRPQNSFEKYQTIAALAPGYHFHPDHIRALGEALDEVLMIHATTLWHNGRAMDVVESYFDEFTDRENDWLSASYYVPNEWMFPPGYLHGLHWYAEQYHDISNIAYHSSLSSEHLDRAFTDARVAKVQHAAPVPKPHIEVTDVTASATAVEPESTVEFIVTIRNQNQTAGTIAVELDVDRSTVASKQVSVTAGSSTQLTFTHTFTAPGEHAVTVNGAHETAITVTAPTTTRPATPSKTQTHSETPRATYSTTDSPTPRGVDPEVRTAPGFGILTTVVSLAVLLGHRLLPDRGDERDE